MRFDAILLATLVSASVFAGARQASAAGCGDAVRWTSDAILPLALVRGASLAPDRDQCPVPGDFHADGMRWHSLDRWGRFVGEVESANSPTGGTIFRQASGTRGVGVFVRGPWSASASAETTPDDALRDSLARWLGKGRSGREVQFFRADAPGAPAAFAVVVRKASILVAYSEGRRWHVAFRESYGKSARWPYYGLRAIVDMNGDGLPEIIYHFNEYADGRGHEVVLAAARGGRRYHQATDNEDNGP